MQRSVDRFVESEDATAEEDPERRDQGPEEALPPVPERMGLIREPDAAEHADEQEHLDRHVGGVGRGLGAQGHRPGHPGRHPQPERLNAIHHEGNEYAAARRLALGCLGHPWYPFSPAGVYSLLAVNPAGPRLVAAIVVSLAGQAGWTPSSASTCSRVTSWSCDPLACSWMAATRWSSWSSVAARNSTPHGQRPTRPPPAVSPAGMKSMVTHGSSPTTHASWPGPTRWASPGLSSSCRPSLIATCNR